MLCGTAVPVTGAVDGRFCCAGCARVFEVLHRLDPEAHQEYLEAARRMGIIPGGVDEPSLGDRAPLPPDPGAMHEERFALTGLWCPSCAWVTEQILAAHTGVERATVDFFTNAATVRFDLRQTSPDRMRSYLHPFGYGLDPVRDEGKRRAAQRLTLAFVICAVLFVNLMSLSFLRYFERAGALDHLPPFLVWLELMLCLPVIGLGWLPIARRAAVGLRRAVVTMDALIAVAVAAAFLLSLSALVVGRDDIYFETAAGLVTISLLGRLIEARLRDRAAADLAGLLRSRVVRVRRVARAGDPGAGVDAEEERSAGNDRGHESYVAVEAVVAGDLVRFASGEVVPVDGVVAAGEASVSEAVLTGEPAPRRKVLGDAVTAGSELLDGEVRLRVTRPHDQTRLSQIVQGVSAAIGQAEGALRSADRVASVFVPGVVAVALGAWLVRLALYGLDHALSAAGWFPSVAVLAVACPCAFSLAGVAAITAAAGALLRRGLLVKEPRQLEALPRTTRLVFDKTGTLTEGAMSVEALLWREDEEPRLLSLMLALEAGSTHPVAEAIRAFLVERGVVPAIEALDGIDGLSGQGRAARVEGRQFKAGARSRFEDPFDPPGLSPRQSGVWFGFDDRAVGCLALSDRARPGAKEVIGALMRQGFGVEMVSGDRQPVCDWLAGELGIEAARGAVSIEQKVARVEALACSGEQVTFVGDGTNDALAMSAAHASVALARSTDEALAASGVVVLGNRLGALPPLFAAARKLRRVIRGNYLWAFGFNTLFIPVAAAGKLWPLAAMLLMLASSSAVLLNSLRMRRIDSDVAAGES